VVGDEPEGPLGGLAKYAAAFFYDRPGLWGGSFQQR
jgi:hypothetical protein